MDSLTPVRLRELKVQATILLKEFKTNFSQEAEEVAARFLQIPYFSNETVDYLLKHSDKVKLKDAYFLIALEKGFKNWAELKQEVVEKDCLYKPSGIAFVHGWFRNYNEAEAYFQQNGGYLLYFWNDFIVCGKEYIECLELGSYTLQWKKIGYNWQNPLDPEAHQFLKGKAQRNYLNQN
ncbi:hypothetical protein [Xanthovirga aplysinae]|uniref:hypothetical protein n=1 Tax=Xanthovirga aplysinae TaxID=2529853 RepID=UPI0012BC92B0|nr:hypothetical protein [Xanthovirga aplysinae]MTI32281.1 hypothetical protein [Xanthovirga aplysinae]